jgi:ribosomal protein L11 methyltransferase
MSVLQAVTLRVPERAVAAFEAALGEVCASVSAFHDDSAGFWTVEGVRAPGAREAELAAALALAAAATGVTAEAEFASLPAEGWLARSYAGFAEQRVGRFAIRGTHIAALRAAGRITLVLDAAAAFGSGEHGSTRGCLRALERIAHHRPRRILDLGTGSGILAMAAARLLARRVLASDIDPWAVRTARTNAAQNGLASRIRILRADGWKCLSVRRAGPYDLVFANILARPLCRMAAALARHLAPGGHAILAGLLDAQARWVLAAHRRHGLSLCARIAEDRWTTLLLRRQA